MAARAAAVGAVTWPTGNGATAGWSTSSSSAAAAAQVVRVARRGGRTSRAVAAVEVAVRCDAPRPRPVTWTRTRVAPQSTASEIAAARATGPGRSCLPPTPGTWPLRLRTPGNRCCGSPLRTWTGRKPTCLDLLDEKKNRKLV